MSLTGSNQGEGRRRETDEFDGGLDAIMEEGEGGEGESELTRSKSRKAMLTPHRSRVGEGSIEGEPLHTSSLRLSRQPSDASKREMMAKALGAQSPKLSSSFSAHQLGKVSAAIHSLSSETPRPDETPATADSPALEAAKVLLAKGSESTRRSPSPVLEFCPPKRSVSFGVQETSPSPPKESPPRSPISPARSRADSGQSDAVKPKAKSRNSSSPDLAKPAAEPRAISPKRPFLPAYQLQSSKVLGSGLQDTDLGFIPPETTPLRVTRASATDTEGHSVPSEPRASEEIKRSRLASVSLNYFSSVGIRGANSSKRPFSVLIGDPDETASPPYRTTSDSRIQVDEASPTLARAPSRSRKLGGSGEMYSPILHSAQTPYRRSTPDQHAGTPEDGPHFLTAGNEPADILYIICILCAISMYTYTDYLYVYILCRGI